jgi:hypothetical protein
MITLFISILFACTYLGAGECEVHTINTLNIINSIPDKDRKEIKLLFQDLFKLHTFAYSLYGDKPITYCDLSLDDTSPYSLGICSIDQYCKDVLEVYSEPIRLLQARWKIWKKYSWHFPIKKYLFFEKSIGEKTLIFFINRESFKKVVKQNIQLFKDMIGTNVSAEGLLSQFQEEHLNIFDILQNNESLLGILLGFGKHNAMLFQQREDLLEQVEKAKKSGIYKLEFLQNKLNLTNSKLKLLHEYDFNIIASINRVMFLADPEHLETIQLRNKYDKLNEKINEIYSKDDWFEQTLIQMTSD